MFTLNLTSSNSLSGDISVTWKLCRFLPHFLDWVRGTAVVPPQRFSHFHEFIWEDWPNDRFVSPLRNLTACPEPVHIAVNNDPMLISWNENNLRNWPHIIVYCASERVKVSQGCHTPSKIKFHVFSTFSPCFYRPPTKLRKGNVFTGVCHSVGRESLCDHYPWCSERSLTIITNALKPGVITSFHYCDIPPNSKIASNATRS